MDERLKSSRPFYYLSKEPIKWLTDQPFVMPLHSSDRKNGAFERFDDTIITKGYGYQITS